VKRAGNSFSLRFELTFAPLYTRHDRLYDASRSMNLLEIFF
jgi:hypothetical protein